jgi:hypothetical protein
MIDHIQSNPQLADATILLHGDHGARIAMKLEDLLKGGGTQSDMMRDYQAAFLAVRTPGSTGKIVDAEVNINDAYAGLLSTDFRNLEPMGH